MSEDKNLFSLLEMIRVVGLRQVWEALLYTRRSRLKDARFAKEPASSGPWHKLGALQVFEQDAQGVVFHGENGSLRVDVLAEDCFRVCVAPGGVFPDSFSYAVAKTAWNPVDFIVEEGEDSIVIHAGDTLCRVARRSLKLTFAASAGRIICEDEGGPSWRGGEVRLSLRLAPHESAHGLGERAFGLNLRGRTYTFWNTDPIGYHRGEDPINMSIPFYVGLRGLHAYGVFWDNSSRGTVRVGESGAEDELLFAAESGALRYYVFTGPTALQVLERYTELTGRMPMPPLWALGYHQSRWSYMSDTEVREIAEEFRRRRIPCDALYLDIDYMDGFRCFTWDPHRFPSPSRLISDLARQGFKTVVICDPGIKVDRRYPVCQSGLREDVFLKYPDGQLFVAPVWPGNCYFPDFTKPAARAWWGRQHAGFLQDGVAGFWDDMGEPAIFGIGGKAPHVPDYVCHDWEGKGATHLEAHNVYGTLMGRATREGVERLQPDRRHLVIIRAGYAGAQRYASSWTADNFSTWDHLRLSVSMCLNLGLSGMAFTGPDVGGFAGNADGELFTRWVQLAALLPFFRAHSAKGTNRHEPWAFGQPYEDIIRRYIELRYRLLPYLYTVFAECAAQGWPIVRPLALLDASFADCDDQYLVGNALLVAPVVEQGATARTVRLPIGEWYDYWGGTLYDGDAEYEVSAPLEALPLYVRAGSVLPHWPVMQHTGEFAVEELTLRVYTGSGRTALYEDAGEGMAYKEGEFRWSHFTCGWGGSGALTLDWQRTGEYRPSYDSIRLEVVGLGGEPKSVELDGQAVPEWRFTDGVLWLTARTFDRLRVQL